MTVWMDLTNSMYVWRGGVVGIIRAELEIAKNIHKCEPNVRFSAYDGVRFVEIAPEKLSWLWEADNVGDAYMNAMGRTQNGASKKEPLTERYSELASAYGYSASRLLRLSHGIKLYLETLPSWINHPLRALGKIIVIPMRKILLIKARLTGLLRSEKISSKDDRSSFSFSYPYKDGDILFSCGWYTSGKETAFSRVKYELRNFTLSYLVYDLIPILPETKSFYDAQFCRCFTDYISWISFQCDYIFYGGITAMEDTQKYQREHGYPVPMGFPVKFGSNIVGSETYCDIDEVRKKYGISKDYLLMVGSLDMRKNYGTIYRAYTILAERYGKENVPDLAIIGTWGVLADLSYTIKNDPQVKDKIIMLSLDDRELDCLYKNCLFFLLASAYEGWSLTLPEALSYHKFCIVSDVPPLREIGKDLVEYVDTYDPFAWAEQIWRYTNDRSLVREKENRIQARYHAVSWEDCGKQIYGYLQEAQRREQAEKDRPVLFLDASTMWNIACSGKSVSGIMRTEILLLYYLFRQYRNIKCFVWNEAIGFRPIYVYQLMRMLCAEDPTEGFLRSRSAITQIKHQNIVQISQKATAFWLICSAFPIGIQKRLIAYGKKRKAELARKNHKSDIRNIKEERLPFRNGDVIFVPGAGSGLEMYERILKAKEKIGFKYSHIIYDYTPILFPQLHTKENIKYHTQLYSFVPKLADLIFFGGANARKDGLLFQQKNGLPTPSSLSIKFGSDIVQSKELSPEEEADMLGVMSIKGPFLLLVGTCEVRKNHETIYRAYLRMLKQRNDLPQIVFAGSPGWLALDFFNNMKRDDRVRGRILAFSPSDVQLDLLYRKCLFTLLPTLYEGWSLTLPESLGYGKFCLCCDNPALRETGEDFVEYVHPWDEVKWAERILYYWDNRDKLKAAEEHIRRDWRVTTWKDCADMVAAGLNTLMEQ